MTGGRIQKAVQTCAALLVQLACAKEPRLVSAALPANEAVELKIVAHCDDDLLFMNPDLAESIELGRKVRTVFLTAGDAGKAQSYWSSREAGIFEAYAVMAGLPNAWQTSTITVEKRRIQVHSLAGASRVSIVLLHLPDGNAHGRGFRTTSEESLAKLWNGRIPALHPLDGSPSLSRSELLNLLTGLMEESEAQTVDLQASTGPFRRDHSDHLHASLFAQEAARSYLRPHAIRAYRGYNVSDEAPNLSSRQQRIKESIFLAYASTTPRCALPAPPPAGPTRPIWSGSIRTFRETWWGRAADACRPSAALAAWRAV